MYCTIFLLAVCVFLDATGVKFYLSQTDDFIACKSRYSCHDCNSAKVCRPTLAGVLQKISVVECSAERPYCDSETSTCVSVPTPACRDTNVSECDSIFSCNDCNTLKVCQPEVNGEFLVVSTILCPETRPYCNKVSGTCVSDEPLDCGARDKFTCMHDGMFPGDSCNVYHSCSNLEATALKCSLGQNYDPRSQTCGGEVPCENFNCTDSSAMKVPHPLDPRYFAYCDLQGPLVIDSCPGSYELNFTSQNCEATCHHNGLIQDIDDSHYYFKCTKIYLSSVDFYFLKERKKCEDGQAFDPSEYLCVSDSSNIPGCTS